MPASLLVLFLPDKQICLYAKSSTDKFSCSTIPFVLMHLTPKRKNHSKMHKSDWREHNNSQNPSPMKQPTTLMTLLILGLILIACSKDEEATPSCKGSIKASFSAGSTVCTAPCPLVFTNSSTGANSYQWNFGDNTTSSEASPSHSLS